MKANYGPVLTLVMQFSFHCPALKRKSWDFSNSQTAIDRERLFS